MINQGHEEIGEQRVRFDNQLGRVKERLHQNTLVVVGEQVGLVDIGVAHDIKRRRVGLAHDGRRSLLANLAHPYTEALLSTLIFFSFDFFGANKRGREWMGREEERAMSGYWKYLSEELGIGTTKRLKYLSDVN